MGKKLYLTIAILLIIPVAYAGLFTDIWDSITGEAQYNNPVDLSIDITSPGGLAIVRVSTIAAPFNPTGNNSVRLNINFTVNSSTGISGLDLNTPMLRVNNSLAIARNRTNVTCSNLTQASCGTNCYQTNFTCDVYMWYFDFPGRWDINVSIRDQSGAYAENITTNFTYGNITYGELLKGNGQGGYSANVNVTWTNGSISVTRTNIPDDGNITLFNRGNSIINQINVTAKDLRGTTYTAAKDSIFAENFSIGNFSFAQHFQACTAGITLKNATNTATKTTIPGSTVQIGNLSHTNYTICIKGLNIDIGAQKYNTTEHGAWTYEWNAV